MQKVCICMSMNWFGLWVIRDACTPYQCCLQNTSHYKLDVASILTVCFPNKGNENRSPCRRLGGPQQYLNSLLIQQSADRFSLLMITGFFVESPTEFHILLYLNHMAVFNFIDEGNVPGCAALKLCDGRKRSMSLCVEFFTASGKL